MRACEFARGSNALSRTRDPAGYSRLKSQDAHDALPPSTFVSSPPSLHSFVLLSLLPLQLAAGLESAWSRLSEHTNSWHGSRRAQVFCYPGIGVLAGLSLDYFFSNVTGWQGTAHAVLVTQIACCDLCRRPRWYYSSFSLVLPVHKSLEGLFCNYLLGFVMVRRNPPRAVKKNDGCWIRAVSVRLEDLLKSPVDAEWTREELHNDEAEGHELDYSPFSSPLSSLTPSPASSRRSSISSPIHPSGPSQANQGRSNKRSRRAKKRDQPLSSPAPPALSTYDSPSIDTPKLTKSQRRRKQRERCRKSLAPPISDVPLQPVPAKREHSSLTDNCTSSKKERNIKANCRDRKRRRYDPASHFVRAQKVIRGCVDYYPSDFNAKELHATGPCFVGQHYKIDEKMHPLKYYMDRGYEVVQWDGR
ncbi:hypothetical protein BDY19DRAFT_903119 [Irpex rosettiformis]|uniref:Uncharacterized protein n=1 Tax=Irpex rosettiformis TaxID=378272 RepID=A0ACB8UG68_9APHY|nr:hypothetical protein BDY19DRAFT_903119 [Irpex rosettiformis]